jgi:phage/plasmid-like protein (TIGR03299 family)
MIDETTGQAAIAFRGETPWHSLGQAIDASDDTATITRKAGLTYDVLESAVLYSPHLPGDYDDQSIMGNMRRVDDRKVLYRSDTLKPLSVVSRDYHVAQPAQIIGSIDEMVRAGGYSIETAGALSGGRRIWVLVRIDEGANIIGEDKVRPYMMAATSYDGTMATLFKFVYMRVVCHNTITAALTEDGREVKVYHSQKFDGVRVRQDMGVALNAFDEWVIKARLLAGRPVTDVEASDLTEILVRPHTKIEDVKQSAGFQSIMGLFKGAAIGSGLTQGGTAWQWLNGVTEYIDHARGRSADTRLNSAWFGAGDKLKSDAEKLALALVD